MAVIYKYFYGGVVAGIVIVVDGLISQKMVTLDEENNKITLWTDVNKRVIRGAQVDQTVVWAEVEKQCSKFRFQELVGEHVLRDLLKPATAERLTLWAGGEFDWVYVDDPSSKKNVFKVVKPPVTTNKLPGKNLFQMTLNPDNVIFAILGVSKYLQIKLEY